MTKQQRLNLSFWIGQWSRCDDKDTPWTREFYRGIWEKYGVCR